METRTERFWKKVGGNENRGNYYGNVKSSIPTNAEMNTMDKYKIIYDIDPQIRKLIISINRAGFKTVGSCAGHSKNERGFVTIFGNFHKLKENERNKLLTIFRNYGLKNIRIYPLNNTLWIRVSFDSIGIIKKENLIRGHESPTSAPSNGALTKYKKHKIIIYKESGYIGISSAKDAEKLRNTNKKEFDKVKNHILIGSEFKNKVKEYEQMGYHTQIVKVSGYGGPSTMRLRISKKEVQ